MSRAFHHPVKHAAPTNLNMRQSRMTGRFSGYLRFIAVWRYLIFSLFFFIFSLAVYSVLPSFIVTIRSYLSISPSLILCVTVSRVRFGIVSSSLSISLAVATSIALTPSSKINRFTPLISALASAILWRCPPERCEPFSPQLPSRPPDIDGRKRSTPDKVRARSNASSEKSSPRQMLKRMVSLKINVF